MISILIPIYNSGVNDLVAALHAQCLTLEVPFEIICLDDGSADRYRTQHAVLNQLKGVRYLELAENIGRSRIRNQLADLAQFPYLLFMDGDSRVFRSDFLAAYLRVLQPQCVIYGGRVYSEQPPQDKRYLLHWHYGRQREAMPTALRSAHPYRTFMTNNFVVPRAVARKIRFDESIRHYGYEDTLYALELKRAGIEILHIDNPLEHLGLEGRPMFLLKVEEALDNLRAILPEHPEMDTRLLQLVRELNRRRLLPLVRWVTSIGLPQVKKLLLRLSKAPLWLLDLYKLGYYLKG